MLWPDSPARHASHSLRQTLHWLRRVAGSVLAPAIEAHRDSVCFRANPQVWIDVFADDATVGDTAGVSGTQRAADLLEGRDFDALPEFAEWLDQARATFAAAGVSRGSAPAQPKAPATCPATRAESPTAEVDTVSRLSAAGLRAERLQAFANALYLYDNALDHLGKEAKDLPRRLALMLSREAILDRLGRRAEQRIAAQTCVALARQSTDPAQLGTALLRLASAHSRDDDPAAARTACDLALEGFRRCGDAPGEAEALRERAFIAWRAGELGMALQDSRAALTIHRKLGDLAAEASALHNLAEITRDAGSPNASLVLFEEAIRLHWASGSRQGAVLAHYGMGQALKRIGNSKAATQQFAHAHELAEADGERTMLSRIEHAQALLLLGDGDLAQALRLMRGVVERDRLINYGHALGHDLIDLARVHLARGERFEALAALDEAQVWFDALQDAGSLNRVLALIAAVRTGDSESFEAISDGGDVRSAMPLAEGKAYCIFEYGGPGGTNAGTP